MKNNGLTKREKECLLKASTKIRLASDLSDESDDKFRFTCDAVRHFDEGLGLDEEYAAFYDKVWLDPIESADIDASPDPIGWRMMLLLWFREVGPRGIE